jgi:hypothetical protein
LASSATRMTALRDTLGDVAGMSIG